MRLARRQCRQETGLRAHLCALALLHGADRQLCGTRRPGVSRGLPSASFNPQDVQNAEARRNARKVENVSTL